MASIEILAGIDKSIVSSIDWDESNHLFSLSSFSPSYNVNKVSYSDIERIELATDENVKLINSDWDVSKLKHKSSAPSVSGWAATFGMVGIVGEILVKGYDVLFIFSLKNGITLICKTTSKHFDKILKDFSNV